MFKLIVFGLVLLLVSCTSSPLKDSSRPSDSVSLSNGDSTSLQFNEFARPLSLAEGKAPLEDGFIVDWNKGIRFKGFGTEPFWDLSIDSAHNLTFKNVEMETPIVIRATNFTLEKRSITYYKKQGDSSVQVLINFAPDCSDGMSDNNYACSVTLTFTSASQEKTVYKGCGYFLSNPAFHNIWVVKEVKAKAYFPEDFQKGIPTLEIFSKDAKVIGHDGCNSFNGSINAFGAYVFIGPLATTRMACKNSEQSAAYQEVFRFPNIKWVVKEGLLYFLNEEEVLMVMRPVD